MLWFVCGGSVNCQHLVTLCNLICAILFFLLDEVDQVSIYDLVLFYLLLLLFSRWFIILNVNYSDLSFIIQELRLRFTLNVSECCK